ncbi:MAG: hypothetical protein M3R61_21470, partial [Chloroflexota bacterium]|nr:hypothetical protein [Chloroflexota bacterium]
GNEEHLAQLVEARTAAEIHQKHIVPAAARSPDLNNSLPTGQPGLGPIEQREMDTRDSPNISPLRGIAPSADAPSPPTIASGLPAPGEPLPAWVPTGSSRQPARPFASPAATQVASNTPTQ